MSRTSHNPNRFAIGSTPGHMHSGLLQQEDGRPVAFDRHPPGDSNSLPAILLCNGLLSDKTGRKASEIRSLSADLGCEAVLFDYGAHGASPGHFQSLGPADWLRDTLLVLDRVVTSSHVVLVGSSLGAWIALLAARSRPEQVHALLLLAPAVDISELHWGSLSPEVKATSLAAGLVPLHSNYVSTPAYVSEPAAPAYANPPALAGGSSHIDMMATPAAAAMHAGAPPQPQRETPKSHAEGDIMAAGAPFQTHQAPVPHADEDVVAAGVQPQLAPAAVVSHTAGDVMLGLNFFHQGSQLLLLQPHSQFAADYASWQAASAKHGAPKQAATGHGMPEQALRGTLDEAPASVHGECLQGVSSGHDMGGGGGWVGMPMRIIHGDEDDTVPLRVSLRLMQHLHQPTVPSPGVTHHATPQHDTNQATAPLSCATPHATPQHDTQAASHCIATQNTVENSITDAPALDVDSVEGLMMSGGGDGAQWCRRAGAVQGLPDGDNCTYQIISRVSGTQTATGNKADAVGLAGVPPSSQAAARQVMGEAQGLLHALYVVEGGDHRLSSPAELCLLREQLGALLNMTRR